jgi:oligosaccharyltransferase complex subunit alpha (ribophorin I)
VQFKYAGKELAYGPIKDVKPLTQHPLRVHFYNNKAALIVKTYEKLIKVAYLRPLLHVQEDFELHHQGAQLKGHFSQVDLKLNSLKLDQTNVVRRLQSVIPTTATDVYFKDAVGNVSTSNLKYEKKRALLELRPRYPLYGGWKYSWFHGYTIPQEPFLVKVSKDEYSISLSLTPSIKGLTIEKGALRVVLPEGASNVRVESQYGAKVSEYKTFTYFDTTGRPTLLIEKSNIVDEFDKKIKVSIS